MLHEALGDSEPTIRIAAATGLANLGEPEGIAELRRILDAGQPVDALQAATVLVDLGSSKPAPKAAAR
jgi:HEAT repeat protein